MHNVETMAWTSERPWHGLGVEVSNDLTAEQMLKAAQLDWTVSTHPIFTQIGDQKLGLKEMALVRDTDNSILDIVGSDWEPNQNQTAFEFFKEFVDTGDMTMETAGSLQDGRLVWGLAKVKESFELFGGDKVESYLLFSNPHKYGWSIDVRFTPVRVVCNNTLTLALSGTSGNVSKQSHRNAFNKETALKTLGIASKKMAAYKETAEFLGSKLFDVETVTAFFDEIFPVISTKKEAKKEHSLNADYAQAALIHQPGVEFAPGSWWQAVNAVTYVTDHMMGRTDENRVSSMWFGSAKDKKVAAFNLAKDYANRA
jgi:phage/plasmid-like protein (TIGR03299 family)